MKIHVVRTTSMKKDKVKKVKPKETKPAEFDKNLAYPIEKALELAKRMSRTKFDASVEVHFRLGIDAKKGEQQVRAAVALPNGTGKTVRVAAFVSPANEKAVRDAGADIVGGEELIAEIKKTEKTDFDVAIAEPEMMRKLAQIAKVLGTRGLMPSPKNETVSPNPALMVSELKKGKVSFKNDDTGNVHVAIGKVSFEPEKLAENFRVLAEAIKKAKPSKSKGVYIRNISISTTMGPGIKVSVS